MQHRSTVATAKPIATASTGAAHVPPSLVNPTVTSYSAPRGGGNNNNHRTPRLRQTLLFFFGAVLVFTQVILPYLLVPAPGADTGANQASLSLSPPGSSFFSSTAVKATYYHNQADGFFNNVPIVHHQEQQQHASSLYSTVHCVGETHDASNAWMYRSCQFRNLCFDTNRSDFVLLENPIETAFQSKRVDKSYISTSMMSSGNHTSTATATSSTPFVAIGGINPRWQGKDFNQGMEKVKWFPRILSASDVATANNHIAIYQLPPHVVLVPFHSLAAHNVGHLLWDDFLPLYTLLQMFGLANDQQHDRVPSQPLQHLFLRTVLPPGQLLYGTCEMRRKKGKKCAENFHKFLPLLGVDPHTFSTTRDYQLVWNNNRPPSSTTTTTTTTLICAKQGVAGMGMLTDHGRKDHGWDPRQDHEKDGGPSSLSMVHNVGRGPLLYSFRNYMVHNFLESSSTTTASTVTSSSSIPFTIVISIHSSSDVDRDLGFEAQITVLRQAFPNTAIHVVQFSNMTLLEQVQLVSKTSLLISTCGGGAMTATFLPRGASVIFYYQESGGFDFAHFNLTGGAAILDWDLFNNAAYLRVHWLPIGSMNTLAGMESLMYLIRHEMDVSGVL
jgi:hypothetical protein